MLPTHADTVAFDCEICRGFIMTATEFDVLQRRSSPDRRSLAARRFAIRRMPRSAQNPRPRISLEALDHIDDEKYLPSVGEQRNNLILLIGNNTEGMGEVYEAPWYVVRAEIGAIDQAALSELAKHLESKHLLRLELAPDVGPYILEFEGWEEFERIRAEHVDSKLAFMAMYYGNPELGEIVENHLKPAVGKTGYKLRRADEELQTGIIDHKLRVLLRRSRFVVADLSDSNHGAYWEAGFAEGLGRPVIYLCRKDVFEGAGTHFDTNHLQTIVWESGRISELVEQLKATIRATLPLEAKLDD